VLQFVFDNAKTTMRLFFTIFCLSFLTFCVSCNQESEEDFGPGEVWKPSSAELSSKNSIEELDLSDSEFVGISKKIAKFKNLKFLILNNNLLKSIPKESVDLKKLIKLNLAKNQLTELPTAILKMENLQELDLRYNKITDLPNDLKNLKNLHTVYLTGNIIDNERKSELRDLMPKTKLVFGTSNKTAVNQ
jgi:hypothetical protein